MRDLVLQKLTWYRERSRGFPVGEMRWRGHEINGTPLSKIQFEALSDSDLLEALELVMIRYYRQM